MTEAQIRDTFRYHSPNPDAVSAHEAIRGLMTDTVVAVAACLPNSRERSTFITLCQQAQMMANAAIAIHGLAPDVDPVRERAGTTNPDGTTNTLGHC